MSYELVMHQIVLFNRDRDDNERLIRRALEIRAEPPGSALGLPGRAASLPAMRCSRPGLRPRPFRSAYAFFRRPPSLKPAIAPAMTLTSTKISDPM